MPVLDQSDIPTVLPSGCPEEEVFVLLNTLNYSKASGADDISAKMLKMTTISISAAIAQISNTSIRLGELPDEWKLARITPIPKDAVSSEPAKFQPISLLSVLSKFLETHIKHISKTFCLTILIIVLLSVICSGGSRAANQLLEHS